MSSKCVLFALISLIVPVASFAQDYGPPGNNGAFGGEGPAARVQGPVIEPELQALLDAAPDNESFRIIISIPDVEVELPPNLSDMERRKKLAAANGKAMAGIVRYLRDNEKKGNAKVVGVLKNLGMITASATKKVVLKLGARKDVQNVWMERTYSLPTIPETTLSVE